MHMLMYWLPLKLTSLCHRSCKEAGQVFTTNFSESLMTNMFLGGVFPTLCASIPALLGVSKSKHCRSVLSVIYHGEELMWR